MNEISLQPQLLPIALNPADIVYTPDWVAKDMIDYFKPIGKVLEPAKGNGAFTQYLSNALWCEIREGRDFFAWQEPVDWIISNPPFSAKIFNDWLNHSFDIAPNIVYLLPPHWIFRSASKLEICKTRGWIKECRFYGVGGDLGFKMGNPVAALYFIRDYFGDTSWSWFRK